MLTSHLERRVRKVLCAHIVNGLSHIAIKQFTFIFKLFTFIMKGNPNILLQVLTKHFANSKPPNCEANEAYKGPV